MVDAFAIVAFDEFVIIVDTHRTSDHLAHARHEQIHLQAHASHQKLLKLSTFMDATNSYRFSEALVICAASHVEGFDFERELDEKDRLVDFVGHLPLGSFRYVLQKCKECGAEKHCISSKVAYLAELVVRAVFLLDFILFQVLDGFRVLHASEGAFRWLEILKHQTSSLDAIM